MGQKEIAKKMLPVIKAFADGKTLNCVDLIKLKGEKTMKIGNYNLPDKVNVLGTEYKIKYSTEETDPNMVGADGYCEPYTKEIYINRHLFDGSEKTADDKLMCKGLDVRGYKVFRHEIIHAFIIESGLWECCDWARNEELTDWIARQFPKMNKVFTEIGVDK